RLAELRSARERLLPRWRGCMEATSAEAPPGKVMEAGERSPGVSPTSLLRPGSVGSLAGRYESREALNKLADVVPRGGIRDLALVVHDSVGTCDEQPAAGPHLCPQCLEHRQPCALREDGAKPAGRSAGDRHRLVAKNLANVGWRPGKPVDGVLGDARNAV